MKEVRQLSNIKTIILCGGIGKRMFPIATDKSLLKFNGVPLIIHQINTARNAGLNEFIIVCNEFNREQLETIITGIQGINVDFSMQSSAAGMADAVLTCSPKIGSDPFILVSSNDIFDTSAYTSLINQYSANEDYDVYVTARKVDHYFPGGYLDVDDNGDIRSIIEKPEAGKEPSNLINIVLHLHTKPDILIDYLNKTGSHRDDVYEKTLNVMLGNKHKMKAVEYQNAWHAIKYPWHILEVMQYFMDKLAVNKTNKTEISNKATIIGKVNIDDNVRILEGATIRGPSYIGKNSVIGNNALVRNSYIGENCVIGYNTEIKQSYINDGCWFHSNYVGDSVIDSNCSLGAGAVTANFRLDESEIELKFDDRKVNTGHDKLGVLMGSDCRVGINTSIMPGIRIGANSVIGPHLNIEQDIDSCKRVFGSFRYVMIDNIKNISDNKRTDLYKKII